MLTLPTTPIVTTRNDPRLLLIYGPPKIGKSTILSQLPGNHIILSTDPRGYEFLTARYCQINNMTEYVEAVNLIKKEPKPFDFVAIDTVDLLEQWSEIEATKLYKTSPIGKNFNGQSVLELPNGGGYLYLRQVFINCITRCLDLAPQVLLISHLREKLIGQVQGQDEVYSKDLDLTGKIKAIVCAQVDAIGYLTRDKDSNLTLSFKTHELQTCGSRSSHLKGQVLKMEGSKFDWSRIYPDFYAKQKPTTV